MAVVIKSGVVALVASVSAFLDAHGLDTVVRLGWRARDASGLNQDETGGANRVVFVPSTLDGNGGKIIQPMSPGDRAIGSPVEATTRTLRTWARALTVSVWGVDTSDVDDESKQIEATETLFEWVVRAVHASAFANAEWGDVRWSPGHEHSFGREILASLVIRHPIFDVPKDVVFPEIDFSGPTKLSTKIDAISARLMPSGQTSHAFTIPITGACFADAMTVLVDDIPATFAVADASHLTLTTPAIRTGTHRVTIRGPGGVATRTFVVTVPE